MRRLGTGPDEGREGDHRHRVGRHGRRWGRALGALVLAITALAGVALPPEAPVAAVAQPTLVAPTPTATTPHVTDGDVRTVAEVGSSVVLGGSFTTSTDPDGTVVNRSYLLAFDKATGRIRRDWVPVLDGEVFSVVAAADGRSVYVGGRFNTVNGAAQLKVARLSMVDGSRLPFQAGFDALVTTMALQGNRLFVGGTFTTVQGRARRVVALNAQTGAIDDTMAVPFAGRHRNGVDGKIWRIEPSLDGRQLLVVGDFATVGGQPRNQIAKLDVGATVTLSAWSTTAFSGYCASFTDYVRDVSFSPDGSYFVVVTTGAKGSGINGTCDSVSRWENTTQSGAAQSWIEYSGGDSYYSVEVTGAAVYVGGHFRYSNNSYGTDSKGPGGVDTPGIASLDPSNGLPLSWNPGRTRGRAVWQLVSTPTGLWVASDTDVIANRIRGRIAFFPLAGGKTVPQPARLTLPATLEQHVPASGATPARVVRRSFDGTTVGAPQTAVADAGALAGVGAAFWADGTLYTAHSDGTLRARSANGTTLGTAATIDLHGLTAFATDLRSMRSALYDQGRLYYTVAGSSTLHMRYFSVENRVVGAQRFDIATSSGAVSYSNITGMVRFGNVVYFADLGTGTLRRATWRSTGGLDPATVATVSPANAGGLSWTSTELWARSGVTAPANQPPVARSTASCTGLRCTFDATTSTDADGTIASVRWTFSDGGTATGPTTTRTFAAAGTYTATATVTDDDGASASVARSVTVAAPTTGSFVTKLGRTGGTSRVHTAPVSTLVRAGDQLLLLVSSNAPGTTSVTAPAGWTRVLDPKTSSSRHAVFSRIATSADAGTSVTVTLGAQARADVVIAVYRGLRLAPSGAATVAGYVTPTRTAAAGDWVLSYWADKSSTTSTWGVPAGQTVRHTYAGTGAGHVAEALADTGRSVAAGTVGGLRATVATPAAHAVAVTLVLRPT